MAVAFVLMFISLPVMRLAALARGKKTADIPLITDVAAYHQVARRLTEVLDRHGFVLKAAQPGWWVATPTRILKWFGGDAFRAFIPDELEYFVSPELELSIYPSGVLLRGARKSLSWAHGLIAETVVHTDGLQTNDPNAQKIERQIRELWKVYDRDPVAHAGSARLTGRIADMTHDLGALDVEFDDWQIVYRQLLQIERAVRGNRQLLDDEANKVATKGSDQMSEQKTDGIASKEDAAVATMSTLETVRAIAVQAEHLIQKQFELAKAELKANLSAEAKAARSLGVSALAGLIGVTLLLVTGALALGTVIPAWLAGLMVSAVVLFVAGVFALVGWRGRVRDPMARSREALKDDAHWTKEQLT
jgi:hypothetical protein